MKSNGCVTLLNRLRQNLLHIHSLHQWFDVNSIYSIFDIKFINCKQTSANVCLERPGEWVLQIFPKLHLTIVSAPLIPFRILASHFTKFNSNPIELFMDLFMWLFMQLFIQLLMQLFMSKVI